MGLLQLFEMKLPILILFHLLFQTCSGQMLGGVPARQGQFPFAVQIHRENCIGHGCNCGGSIIGNRWVLTAAHCVRENGTNRNIGIVAGDVYRFHHSPHRLEIQPDDVQIHAHSQFDGDELSYDAALLFTPKTSLTPRPRRPQIDRIEFGREGALRVGHRCTVMGWGRTRVDFVTRNAFASSPFLKHGELTVTNNTRKHIVFINLTRDGSGPRPLDGDSGSPLVCGDRKLFGWMRGGSIRSDYARFMKLDFFRTWITNKIREVMNQYRAGNVRGVN